MKKYFFAATLLGICFLNACQNNDQRLKEKELELKIKEVELEKQKLKNSESQSESGSINQTDATSQELNTTPPPQNYYARGAGRYPQGSERRITYADIQNLSNVDLRIMRNEIFARHGYIFKSEDLIQYFNQQSWYRPLYSDVTSRLSSLETDNINYIKSFEN